MDLTLKKQVEEILKTIPDTRNSDITLMLELWRRYYPQRIRWIDGIEMIALGSLYDIAREDNIKRIRAEFNAKGRYLPTSPEVLKQRGIEENKWRESLGYSPIARTKFATYNPSKDPEYPNKTAELFPKL